MPPKAKKDKKNKAKISIDDVDTTILTRVKLEEFCVRVCEELEKEKQHSEFLRLDRDKLVNMVTISRERLNVLRETNRQHENEIRDAEDKHRVKMAFDRQRVIHLKNEFESGCVDQKLDTMKIITEERENHNEVTVEINSDINFLKYKARQMEINHLKNKEQLEKEHAEHIHKIHNEEQNTDILSETKRDKHSQEISTQFQIVFSTNLKELEHLKNKEYQNFLDDNSNKTTQLKHYYNRIVSHNKETIQLLKNKIQELKYSVGNLDKQYLQVKEENQMLTDELNRLNKEKIVLQKKLSSSEQNKNILKKTKNQLEKKKSFLFNLKIEYGVLDMINEKRSIINNEKSRILSDKEFKLCANARKIILVLEFYMVHVYNSGNEINNHLSQIKSILDGKGKCNALLSSVSECQDTSMDLINYEIAQILDERKDLFRRYRKILRKFNVPLENTGFVPLHFEEILSKIDNPRMLVKDG